MSYERSDGSGTVWCDDPYGIGCKAVYSGPVSDDQDHAMPIPVYSDRYSASWTFEHGACVCPKCVRFGYGIMVSELFDVAVDMELASQRYTLEELEADLRHESEPPSQEEESQ